MQIFDKVIMDKAEYHEKIIVGAWANLFKYHHFLETRKGLFNKDGAYSTCGRGRAANMSSQKSLRRYLEAIFEESITSSPLPITREEGATKAVLNRTKI